jgi:cyclopropane-fatty-acyl-phospholipid synthase
MLYKFKSRATSDLIMLEANGRQVLQIIGKAPEASGIITPDQMPQAIAALERAVKDEERSGRPADAQEASDDDEAKEHVGVTLRQRVAPFVDMLRQSQSAGKEVVWGV